VAAIRAAGDNTGSMALKGAHPDHEGPERPDRWPLQPGQDALGVDPALLRQRVTA
jgi:hypothetical protein